MKDQITWDDFTKIDIRVGTVVTARPNPKARKPALVLEIDFGPLGRKITSAQITDQYDPTTIVGQQVTAIVNFAPKLIAGVKSEVLVMGALSPEKGVVLLQPTQPVEDGSEVG